MDTQSIIIFCCGDALCNRDACPALPHPKLKKVIILLKIFLFGIFYSNGDLTRIIFGNICPVETSGV